MDLDKWVTGERNEIKAKRAKVQDTCADIGAFLQKTEKEKKYMLDCLGGNTPRGLRRSSSQLTDSQDSEGLRQVKDQLRGIREGGLGGEKPETKYLNKKRDFVKQLMKEKKSAVEKGVKDKMRNFESEMIDEMLQAALNLDVDAEVENRIEIARKMVEEGRIDESSSYPGTKNSHSRSAKKNVTFQSPKKAERFSASSHSQKQDSSVSKNGMRQLGASIGELEEDMIGESIKLEESYQPSAASASKSKKSNSFKTSAGKPQAQQKSRKDQDADSLSRDEDVDYSNEFISESIPSASLSRSDKAKPLSAKALQQKAADIEESGYTEVFEDVSIGQSQSNQFKKQLDKAGASVKIDTVNEEEDNYQNSSHVRSEADGSSPHDAKDSSRTSQVDQSGELRDSAPSPQKEQSELEDKEVSQSTDSIDWQIILQAKAQNKHTIPVPEVQESELDEAIEERSDLEEADLLQDLESCPSGSIGTSVPKENDDFKIDQITEELLKQILGDFKMD